MPDPFLGDRPPKGVFVEGPLLRITGGEHRLIIQVGQTLSGKLVPTGFVLGCENPPHRIAKSAVQDFSFAEIMSAINDAAVPELFEEAPLVGSHPGPLGWPDSHYQEVARVYEYRTPGQPLRILANQWGVTVRTFYRWLDTARSKGYLSPE